MLSRKRMTKKLKQQWIEALLSGEYKQGAGQLVHQGRYCCLGVLQKVAKVKASSDVYLINARDCDILLPYTVQNALGSLNDYGVPFEVIAGLIDEAL